MMKKVFWILICLCFSLNAIAQQQGIVRTLERPGKPSTGIQGVTINVLEYPNAIVSKKGGRFSFNLDNKRQGESFTVTRIQKKGYSLVDKQLKGRRFAYSSSVPIEIVLVSDEQLEIDKKRIEDKAYEKAQKNYTWKMTLLEKQLKEKTISEREYREKYEELNNNYNNYIQLIDQMAERYATTDYKGLSDINREIQSCIEDAELERADMLIDSKGDLDKREQELLDKIQLKHKSEQLSQQLQYDIDQQLEDLIRDYYIKFSINAAAYQNDSAAYYLEHIVRLDSTDAQWLTYTANYIDTYLADYPRALKYFMMALDHIDDEGDENAQAIGNIYQRIGLIHDNCGDPDQALEWHHKSLDYLTKAGDSDSSLVAMAYTLIGRAYLSKNDYDRSLEYTLKGLDMREHAAVKDSAELAQSYNNLGVIYGYMNNPEKALQYHHKALDLRAQKFGEDSPLAAFSHMNIGSIYYNNLNDYDKALEHFIIANQIFHKIYGNAHPHSLIVLNYLSSIYDNQGLLDKALEYDHEYLKGLQQYYGAESTEAAKGLIKLGSTLQKKKDYVQSLDCYRQALKIYQETPGAPQEMIEALNEAISITTKQLDSKP